MAKINLKDGRSITVSDSFLQKPKAEQDAIVRQIVNQMGGQSTEQVGGFEDVARAVPSGLKSGTEGLIGADRATGSYIGQKLGKLASWFGADQQHQQAMEKAGEIGFLSPLGLAAEGLKQFGGPDYTRAVAPAPADVKGLLDKTPLSSLNYQPSTIPGKIAESAAATIPSALAFGSGSIPARLVSGASIGAGSELGGLATEGTGLEPYARFIGGMAGPMVMALGNRMLRPGGTPAPDRAAATQVLEDQGVTDLTAGQRTGSRLLTAAENELGGEAYNNAMQAQQGQFTQAALRNAGILDDTASGQALAMNRARLGQEFDRLAATTTIPFDINLQYRLRQLTQRYGEAAANIDPAVQRMVDRVAAMGQQHGGQIPGTAYQNLNTELRTLAETASPETQQALNGVRTALNEAVERGLQGNPSIDPNLLQQWRAARTQWRNQLILEDAVTKGAAENQFSGVITPARLNTSADTIEGSTRSGTGQSELANLGAAGQKVMKPMQSSETAVRSTVRNPITGLPSLAIGTAFGNMLMSPNVQRYLAMQGPQLPIGGRSLLTLAMSGLLQGNQPQQGQ